MRRIIDRLRAALALLGYFLSGAAVPFLLLIAAEFVQDEAVGVGLVVLAGIVAAAGLNLLCRRFLVHLFGAVAAWLGCAIGGGLIICWLFAGFSAASFAESITLVGWIGLWTVFPVAVVINGAAAIVMHYALPRRGSATPRRCAKCGYSLRDLPHRRCPECGTTNRVFELAGRVDEGDDPRAAMSAS
ncbi:MAG: hypothetical protein ACYTGG_08420 [Planctomycetota bacterium]|jgi:MFS family permease